MDVIKKIESNKSPTQLKQSINYFDIFFGYIYKTNKRYTNITKNTKKCLKMDKKKILSMWFVYNKLVQSIKQKSQNL